MCFVCVLLSSAGLGAVLPLTLLKVKSERERVGEIKQERESG